MNTSDLFNPHAMSLSKLLDKYYRLEYELILLSGHNIEGLRDLFARGYTLTPPKPNNTLLAEAAELAMDDDRYPHCFGHYYLEPFNKPCEDGEAGLCSHCRECRRADPLY